MRILKSQHCDACCCCAPLGMWLWLKAWDPRGVASWNAGSGVPIQITPGTVNTRVRGSTRQTVYEAERSWSSGFPWSWAARRRGTQSRVKERARATLNARSTSHGARPGPKLRCLRCARGLQLHAPASFVHRPCPIVVPHCMLVVRRTDSDHKPQIYEYWSSFVFHVFDSSFNLRLFLWHRSFECCCYSFLIIFFSFSMYDTLRSTTMYSEY